MAQNTNSIIKLALVFFISMLSFAIGTYVGKKYSDNQHKLATLEPQKESQENHSEQAASAKESENAERSVASTHEGTNHEGSNHGEPSANENSHQGKALTDAEVAKIAEEFANDNKENKHEDGESKPIKTATEHEEKEIKSISGKPNPSKAHMAETTHSEPATAKSLTRPAAEQIKKMDTEKVERDTASLHPRQNVAPIQFTVQVGSFPTAAEASKLTQDLKGKGYKTSYTPAQVNGQTWYRVNVGLFDTVKEAQDYKKDFLEKTNMSSAIVQKIQN